MNSGDALPDPVRWLYGTQWFGIKLGLDGARRLAREMGVVLEQAAAQKIIHVAGTNGKGSTCAMLSSICRAHGLRTGLYTSPHLVSLKERFQIDGACITELALCEALSEIRERIKDWEPHPTFFEITTILALQWFQRERVEVLILETGMGGRLDATNIVTPAVSVLTPIGLDHQQYLGETLAEIAGEKSGIMKPRVPVVSAPQEPAALTVLEAEARRLDCRFELVQQPWGNGPLGLAGEVQRWNAALAVAALEAGEIHVSQDAIKKGLADARWPGRFDRVRENLVLDGAHNAHAAKALCATWKSVFPNEKASLIFGALQDKEQRELLKALEPIVAEITFVPVNNPRAASVADLLTKATEFLPEIPSRTATSLTSALTYPTRHRRLVTGSLYLVGEALGLLANETQERSAQ